MGGRGSQSKLGGGSGSGGGTTKTDNIVQFKSKAPAEDKDMLWDYRGDKRRVDELIAYADKAKTPNTIQRAALALKREDAHITKLLGTVKEDDGDPRALMALRRRVRQQMIKVKKENEINR